MRGWMVRIGQVVVEIKLSYTPALLLLCGSGKVGILLYLTRFLITLEKAQFHALVSCSENYITLNPEDLAAAR